MSHNCFYFVSYVYVGIILSLIFFVDIFPCTCKFKIKLKRRKTLWACTWHYSDFYVNTFPLPSSDRRVDTKVTAVIGVGGVRPVTPPSWETLVVTSPEQNVQGEQQVRSGGINKQWLSPVARQGKKSWSPAWVSRGEAKVSGPQQAGHLEIQVRNVIDPDCVWLKIDL